MTKTDTTLPAPLPGKNYESELCGSLPIHQINQVQPHGVLLVIDRASLTIIQASENTEAVFGVSARELVGTPLRDYGDALLSETMLSGAAPGKLPETWVIGERSYTTLVHVKDPYILAEIELAPAGEKSFVAAFQDIRHAMAAIESAPSIKAACAVAARELKRLSGFDKVMVYRFDADWNGYVEAEVMEEGMESYDGFTFPASDIPPQARRLYLTNPYRFMPDRDYTPVHLYPVINPATQAFIDLSDCNLRAVAGVHVEYLRNMGVTASMSTRILDGDRLWGLVACHHRTPKSMDYALCSMFEWMSHVISARIASIRYTERQNFSAVLHERYNRLVEGMYGAAELQSSLLDPETGAANLLGAGGAILSYRGRIHQAGQTPPRAFQEDLVLWLHTKELKRVFATDAFSSLYDQAAEQKAVASGILVIPLNWKRDEYIILFRPEVLREINWGGNPDERIRFEANHVTYHPRASFRQWKALVSGTSAPWKEEEIAIADNLRTFIHEYIHNHLL
jgi:light-regulated signal transduction histidine kinase (bacteriophytochrome)